MKKLLITCLSLLIICAAIQAHALSAAVQAAVSVSAAAVSCTTSTDSKLFAPVTQPGTSVSSVQWKAIRFTIAATKTITAYKVRIQDLNQTGSVSVMLMADDATGYSGAPQPEETNIITDSTATLGHAAISDTEAVVEFALATPISLSAGTYWIVTKGVSGASYNLFYTGSTGDRICYEDGSAPYWDNCLADYMYDMEVWGCD